MRLVRMQAWKMVVLGGVLLGAGCSFDIDPILPSGDASMSDADPTSTGSGGSGGGTGPVRLVDAGMPDAGRSPTVTIPEGFGLTCGGVTCPIASNGGEQCCTAAGDVDERRARSASQCGLDLGTGCYEIEQPGVADPRCPSVTPEGSTAEEIGCCTTAGRCGSWNGTQSIGCHHNPEIDQGCDQDIDRDVTCEQSGIFAIRAAVDVTWGGRNVGGLVDLTDSGRGDIVIKLLARIEDVEGDGTFTSTIHACSTELPEFYSSVLCESYLATFSEAIWDSGAVPPVEATGRFQCPHPGCILTFDPVTALIGIDLDDPNGLWPLAQTSTTFGCPGGVGLDCFPDHDADGERGITITLQTEGPAPKPSNMSCPNGYTFRSPPLNSNPFAIIGGVRRTDRLHLGVRVRLGASGRIESDCESGAGGGVVDFVQSRAGGCMVQPLTADPFQPLAGPNDACTSDERLFIDESLPIYTILRQGDAPAPTLVIDDHSSSDGPDFSLVRIGDADDDVTCADVRAVTF